MAPGSICKIVGCNGKTELKSIPKGRIDNARRLRWLRYCKPGTESLKCPFVCINHFSDAQFIVIDGKKFLKPFAEPDVNLPRGALNLPSAEAQLTHEAQPTAQDQPSHADEPTSPDQTSTTPDQPTTSMGLQPVTPVSAEARTAKRTWSETGLDDSTATPYLGPRSRKRYVMGLTPRSKVRRTKELSSSRNKRRLYLPSKVYCKLREVSKALGTTAVGAVEKLCSRYLAEVRRRPVVSETSVGVEQSTPLRRPPPSTTSTATTNEPAANIAPWQSPVALLIRRDSEDELLSDDDDPQQPELGYDVTDLPPGAAAEEEEAGDLPPVTDDHARGEESRWPVKSAVVTETCLVELLSSTLVKCRCGRKTAPTIERVSMSFNVKWTCSCCQTTVKTWSSTAKESQRHLYDVLFAGALIMSGNHYSKVADMFKFMNLGVVNPSTFRQLQLSVVRPVVLKKRNEVLTKNCDEARLQSPAGLVVAGDCQNDSPGHCAAYGTYTVMDTVTERIVAQETVFRSETAYSSPQLEVVGAERCVRQLTEERGLVVREFVSDQHLGVKKRIKELLPDVEYSLDVWHAAKNVSKDLRQASSKSATRSLVPWIGSIKNHFWYCAQTANGSKAMFMKNWTMSLHHVCGDHGRGHPNGGDVMLSECLHGELSEEQLAEDAKRQLVKDGPAHRALRSVIYSAKTNRRVDGVLNFRHTGALESFHSTTLAYTPKRVYYDQPMFETRKAMAVIDHDAHCHRKQLVNSDGVPLFTTKYSKAQKKNVLVKRKEEKGYSYIREMLREMMATRRSVTLVAPATASRYVNPSDAPTSEEKERLLAERAGHSRFT